VQQLYVLSVQRFAKPVPMNAKNMIQNIAENVQKLAGVVLRSAGKWQPEFMSKPAFRGCL